MPAMIRVARACSIAGVVLLTASASRAAPAARPADRAPRPSAGLESADPDIRRDAIARLVTARDPTAVAQLALALEGDDSEVVRQAAASGLGDLADKRGVAALRRCLQQEPSQVVKRSCRVSLGRIDPSAATLAVEPAPAAPAPAAPAPATTAVGPAPAPATTAAANPQVDLRINVTAQDAIERPNHVYLELWSAIDQNTLSLGYERIMDTHWSMAVETGFSAESQSAAGAKVSVVAAAVAVRPHYYFLQQAPSGPFIAPFASVGYSRATIDFPSNVSGADDKISGTVWSVGAGVGWSLVINARAVLKLSAVFAYSKTAATAGMSGLEASSSAAAFNPFVSAGIML